MDGGRGRKKDRPVSRNRKARFLRGGQVKRERWPLDGLHRRTIPPLRPIEEGWRFWHAALLKLSDTFSRPQKTTFILQRKRLGGNEIARWKCCSCTHTYLRVHTRTEGTRGTEKEKEAARVGRQFSPSFSRRFAMETARRGSVITAFDRARTTEAKSWLKAAVATSTISWQISFRI